MCELAHIKIERIDNMYIKVYTLRYNDDSLIDIRAMNAKEAKRIAEKKTGTLIKDLQVVNLKIVMISGYDRDI